MDARFPYFCVGQSGRCRHRIQKHFHAAHEVEIVIDILHGGLVRQTVEKLQGGTLLSFWNSIPIAVSHYNTVEQTGPQIRFHRFQSLRFFSVWLPLYRFLRSSRDEEVIISFLWQLA
jgi:hypothetical protein